MYWFRRPKYGKWVAAGALVLLAFAMDVSNGATDPYPFARSDLTRGDAVSAADIEWRDVPAGLLAPPTLEGGLLTRNVVAGEPLLPSTIGDAALIPEGWWAVPVGLPETVTRGTAVRIVLPSPARAIDGIVVDPGGSGTFGVAEAGLVAVPGADAVAVASAVARDELTILIAP